jgi:hypothetical protein
MEDDTPGTEPPSRREGSGGKRRGSGRRWLFRLHSGESYAVAVHPALLERVRESGATPDSEVVLDLRCTFTGWDNAIFTLGEGDEERTALVILDVKPRRRPKVYGSARGGEVRASLDEA